jgi:hypothetical protein
LDKNKINIIFAVLIIKIIAMNKKLQNGKLEGIIKAQGGFGR